MLHMNMPKEVENKQEFQTNSIAHDINVSPEGEVTTLTNTVEPLGTDTSLLRTVSYVPTKFSYISLKKKKKKKPL